MKRRIFVAIDIPDDLKNTCEAYLAPFYKQKFVRIPKRDGWHITLVFCGYLDETEIQRLIEIAGRAVSQTKPFQLNPSIILFATESRPRMVWLKFKNSPEFEKLKKQIEEEMKIEEGRNAVPHLTLARFDQRHFRNFKKLLPENGIDISKETEPFLVNSINIMESHLTRQGAEYELVFKAPLQNT